MVDEAYGNKKNETVGGAKEDWQIGKQNKTRLCTNYFISYIFFFSCFFFRSRSICRQISSHANGFGYGHGVKINVVKAAKKGP